MVWIIVNEETWHHWLGQIVYRGSVHAVNVQRIHKCWFWQSSIRREGILYLIESNP